jgi:hypothetical protein
MARNQWEIEQTTSGFRARVIVPAGSNQSPWENYFCSQIHSVSGTDIAGFGTRQPDNNRKNPTREDDNRKLLIYFNKDESSPISYEIKYVDNQAGWTDDTAGILQAISDVASWCGGVGTTLIAIEDSLGNTPVVGTTVANATPAAAGTTAAGVKGYSIQFEGTGGTLNTVPMDSGYSSGKAAPLGNVFTAGQAYVVPNVADVNFPNSPRVLIEYIT